MVSNYSVCLDPNSLRHLYLRHAEDCEVLQLVFVYLQENSKGKPPLFHLSNQEPTLDFAEEYSRESHNINRILQSEIAAADTRKKQRWEEIQNKKVEADSIRQTLKEEKMALAEWQNTLAKEKALSRERHWANTGLYSRRRIPTSSEERMAQQQVNSWEWSISQNKNRLERVLKPPPHILQPLPRSEALSYRVLFFLYRPKILSQLSEFGCAAQRMLLPRSNIDSAFTVSAQDRSPWFDYYNANRGMQGATKHSFFLEYATKAVPKSVGDNSVDLISSMENGVWYYYYFVKS